MSFKTLSWPWCLPSLTLSALALAMHTGKKELDKKRALELLKAKDEADPTRVTKRKERASEVQKARRLNAKQNLKDLLGQISQLRIDVSLCLS